MNGAQGETNGPCTRNGERQGSRWPAMHGVRLWTGWINPSPSCPPTKTKLLHDRTIMQNSSTG